MVDRAYQEPTDFGGWLYSDEAGPNPKTVLGSHLAQEIADRGYNPWSRSGLELMFRENVPPGTPISFDNQSAQDAEAPGGYNRLGVFDVPYRGMPTPPILPEASQIRVNPDLPDEKFLLTTRHELQHAREYYNRLNQLGVEKATEAHPQHFWGGPTEDVERSFIKRPYIHGW